MHTPIKETLDSLPPHPALADNTEQAHFIERAERQLEDWSTQIEHLTTASVRLTGDEYTTAAAELKELRAKVGAARHKLNTHKSSSGAKWHDAKLALDGLWTEVKALFVKRGVKMSAQDEVTERHFL